MGNCLVVEEKVIKVMKPDGKILEYKTPTIVQQVLSDFSGYAVSDSVETYRHLLPETKLLGGCLYYLIPLPLPSPSPWARKKVRFQVPEEEESRQEIGAVRIKVIISKQELQEILQRGGISVRNMVTELQNQEKVEKKDLPDLDDEYRSWKPVLESIPEID